MAGFKIKVQFDDLGKTAKVFSRQAQSTSQTLRKINGQISTLQSGGWVGKGAKAFYNEMERSVLPALKALIEALEGGATGLGQVAKVMHDAEDEATRLFLEAGGIGAILGGIAAAIGAAAGTGGSAGGGAGGGAGGATGGAGGASSESGVPAWKQANPLLVRDPNELFSDSYMRGMIGSQFQGAGPQLGHIMFELSQNPSGEKLDGLLVELANIRGRGEVEIQIEWEKFQEVQAQQEANTPTPDDAPPELSGAGGGGGSHPSFNGSNTQMRYGKVVGDAFGIDPAFGAMLNPTGGLVGPGNWAIAGDDTAVGYHGVMHDAAGYLYNYHDTGPGYDYLGLEHRDTSSTLSGQREGIAYWRQATGGPSPVSAPVEWMMRDFVGRVDMASSVVNGVRSLF
jgi:WXG100 family type VII secretion target